MVSLRNFTLSGLEAEKKALELTISTINNEKSTSDTSDSSTHQQQIQTLMKNISTLSSEKSRMEQLFQSDRRNLKQEINEKNLELDTIKEKMEDMSRQNIIEIGQIKSKLIVAQNERTKEHNASMAMIRELQNLLSDERRLKDNLEMQLADLKFQLSQISNSGKSSNQNNEIDSSEEIKTCSESKDKIALESLQKQILALKQQNKATIENEQRRTNELNERSKKLAEIHEERVQNLEEKLAELTGMISSYNRLRNSDQENIIKLKEKIVHLELNQSEQPITNNSSKHTSESPKSMLENIDVSQIFLLNEVTEDDLRHEYEKLKQDFQNNCEDHEKKTEEFVNKIKMLQEKIRNLNRTIEECETELKNKNLEYQAKLKQEKCKWQNMISSVESESRSKLNILEQQLQKQRDRSMNLLEEKENEIRTIKLLYESTNNFNDFHYPIKTSNLGEEENNLNTVLNTGASSSSVFAESCHMIHYSNELARKDLELSKMRKSKKDAETALRKIMTEKVEMKDGLEMKIERLEQQVERLQRYKSREGANLEYLKNVTLSFIVASSNDSKIHMLKAIGTVLKFDDNEMKSAVEYIMKQK